MKKSFIWTLAAALTCSMAFTSCSKQDYPTPWNDDPTWNLYMAKTTIDFEDDVTPFTADSRITTGVGTVDGWDSKVATFKGGDRAQNGYSFAHYNFSDKAALAKQILISFDYFNANSRAIVTIGDALVRGNGAGAGCGKTSYGAKGAIFRIGSDKNNFFINGTTMGGVADWCNQWLKVELAINCFDRQYTWAVKNAAGEVVAASEEVMDYWQADANEATQIDVFGYINNGNNCYIDNLTIVNGEDTSVKYADAKIIYVDPDGNELKEARIVTGNRVGTYITLLGSDKDAIYNADKTVKWVYDTDNAAETAVAEEGTVITIKFKDSGKYAIRLDLVLQDGNNTRVKRYNGEVFIGDNLTAYYPIAFKGADGKFYVTPKAGTSDKDAKQRNFTFETAQAVELPNGTLRATKTIEYSLIPDITFISEFENSDVLTLTGSVSTWIGWTDPTVTDPAIFDTPWSASRFTRFSNGAAARLTEGSYFTTTALTAGTYKVFIHGRSGVSAAQTVALYVMDEAGNMTPVDLSKTTIEADTDGNYNMPTISGGLMGAITFGGIAIPEGGKLVVKNDGLATGLDLDFIALSLNAEADLDALTN